MNNHQNENYRSRSRSPHRPNESNGRGTGQASSTTESDRQYPSTSLQQPVSATNSGVGIQLTPLPAPVSSWTSLINKKEFLGIGRNIINLEDVKIPRKASEGLRPLFDRDELRESIKLRMAAGNDEDNNVVVTPKVQLVFPTDAALSLLDKKHNLSHKRRENGSLSGGIDAVLQYRKLHSETAFESALSSLSSGSRPGNSGVSDIVNNFHGSPDRYDNSRSPGNVSPMYRQRGPSPDIDAIRENERRRERQNQRQQRQERHRERANMERHSFPPVHVPRPPSRDIQEIMPTRTLQISWLDNVIGDLRSKLQLQHINEVLRRHFQEFCDVPVLSVSYRPLSTWIMFKSVNHAAEALFQIRRGPLVFMYEHVDRGGHHQHLHPEPVRYDVEFSQSERWIELDHS